MNGAPLKCLQLFLAVGMAITSMLAIQLGWAQDPNIGGLRDRYTILVHGGTISTADQVTDAHREFMRSVVSDARDDLAGGKPALDVVVRVIAKMEDSGLFDAGKGSFLNTAGFVETDASLMEGHTGRVGAVAAMQRLKNPIVAARIVMDKSPHVFFVGPTGEKTLVGLGAEVVDDPAKYFVPIPVPKKGKSESGTVGAVVLDRYGHLAAGTSTGGYEGKLPGRVGDSPIVGASTYADDRFALSATGKGENFIRRSVTLDIAKRCEYLKLPLQESADHVVRELLGKIDQIDGAIIAISRDGEIVLSAANVRGVFHGFASESIGATVGEDVPQTDFRDR